MFFFLFVGFYTQIDVFNSESDTQNHINFRFVRNEVLCVVSLLNNVFFMGHKEIKRETVYRKTVLLFQLL